MPTLLVFGYGRLGSQVVDQLALRFPEWNFVVASRHIDRAIPRINLTRYTLAQWGLFPLITHEKVDLRNIDETASTISRLQPSIIFNATTPFPWWKIDNLPDGLGDLAHRTGPGMWAACDVVLPMYLTRAMELAKSTAIHVNGCYPDLTNSFLADSPMSPVVGIGNISNVVPGLQLAYAAEHGVHPREVQIRLVGHHFTSLNAPSTDEVTPAPFALEVSIGSAKTVIEGPESAPFQLLRRHALRTRGSEGQAVTVGSASTVLAAFMANRAGNHHAPGALGLPGGYPIHIDSDGNVSLDLPHGVTIERARVINEDAQRFDGTASVRAREARPTAASLEAQERILGFTTDVVTPENCREAASQIVDVLNHRYGLGLDTL